MSIHRLTQTPLAAFADGCGLDLKVSKVQARLFDQDWLDSLDSLTGTLAEQERIMDKLRHYKGVQFWTYTLDMTDRMYPVQQHSGVRSHLSRNVFEQISARLFLESFERGPFEQGAGSASDGTVVQRVDDAPAEIPAEEPAPSRPSSPPKNGLRHSLLHHHSLLHQNGLHHSLLKVRRRLRQSERSQRQRSPARSVGGPTGWRRSPYTRWLPVRAAHRRQRTPRR